MQPARATTPTMPTAPAVAPAVAPALAVVQVQTANGGAVNVSAHDLLSAVQGMLGLGLPVAPVVVLAKPGASVSVMDAATAWVKWKVTRNRWKAGTIERTGHDVRVFAQLDQHRPIDAVDEAYVRRYINSLSHLRLYGRKTRFHAVAEFLAWCVRRKYLAVSPVAAIDSEDLPWVGKKAKADMGRGKLQLASEDEARAYLRAANRWLFPTDRVAAMLPLLTGLCTGEVLHLRVRDIDFAGKRIWIRGENVDESTRPGGPWNPKTESRWRSVGIPRLLSADLAELCRQREPAALLFPSLRRRGKPWEDRWLLRIVQRTCAAAQIPAVCTHGLRGTYSTLLRNLAHLSSPDIAVLLGHSDTGATAEAHYIGSSEHQPALDHLLRS